MSDDKCGEEYGLTTIGSKVIRWHCKLSKGHEGEHQGAQIHPADVPKEAACETCGKSDGALCEYHGDAPLHGIGNDMCADAHQFKPGVVAAPPCGHCGHAHDYGNGACKETPCPCSGWVPVVAAPVEDAK